MFNKSLGLLSVLSLLGACSHHHHHQPMKKAATPHRVSKSFLDLIRTKKPGKPQTDKRVPASAKSVPGLKELVAAIRLHPEFLKVPVGFEVATEHKGSYDGTEWNEVSKIIFLKQNFDGFFTLETVSGQEPSFNLEGREGVESIETSLSTIMIREIKQTSPVNFTMTMEMKKVEGFESCTLDLNLRKSASLTDSTCRDAKGNIISTSRIVSTTPIKISDYVVSLKSTKLTVSPIALSCVDGDYDICHTSVTDAEAKDWSYLLK